MNTSDFGRFSVCSSDKTPAIIVDGDIAKDISNRKWCTRTFNINGYDLVKWSSDYDIDRCRWTIAMDVCQPFAGLFGVAPDDVCAFYDYMDEDPRGVDFDHMACIILHDFYRELAKVSQEMAAAYAKKLEGKDA